MKTQQQLVAKLKFLRTENAELKKEVAALTGEVTVSGRLIKIEQERGDFFKVAAEKGIKVSDNCGLMQERYDRMEATYKSEVSRLQTENDNLRESRTWRSLFAAGGGAAVGYGICSRGR